LRRKQGKRDKRYLENLFSKINKDENINVVWMYSLCFINDLIKKYFQARKY